MTRLRLGAAGAERLCALGAIPLDASMQQSFASLLPELASDLASELRATGRTDLAVELETATVRAVTSTPTPTLAASHWNRRRN